MGWSPKIPGGRSDPNRRIIQPHHFYPGLKAAMYLDPVTRDTGCLWIKPDSQISSYHEMLAPIFVVAEPDPSFHRFGHAPADVPCHWSPIRVTWSFHSSNVASSFWRQDGTPHVLDELSAAPTNDFERQLADDIKIRRRRIDEESRREREEFQ